MSRSVDDRGALFVACDAGPCEAWWLLDLHVPILTAETFVKDRYDEGWRSEGKQHPWQVHDVLDFCPKHVGTIIAALVASDRRGRSEQKAERCANGHATGWRCENPRSKGNPGDDAFCGPCRFAKAYRAEPIRARLTGSSGP